ALAHREWRANRSTSAQDVLRDCPEDLRGWEWHYLDRLCLGKAQRLTSPGQVARNLALSPDGSRVACVGLTENDYAVTVWELPSGTEVWTTPRVRRWIVNLALRAGGDQLAVVTDEGAIQVWDLGKRQSAFSLRGADLPPEVRYSGDGRRLVAVSRPRNGQSMA